MAASLSSLVFGRLAALAASRPKTEERGDRALVVLRDGSHRLTSGASASLNGYSRIRFWFYVCKFAVLCVPVGFVCAVAGLWFPAAAGVDRVLTWILIQMGVTGIPRV